MVKQKKFVKIAKKTYKVKCSHRDRSSYCSKQCQAISYRDKYKGINNPNFNKNVDRDYNGYKLTYKTGSRESLHKLVVFETLNINSIPKGYNVHHRDCNINDNTPENLVVLSCSDHRWLHKQFGNATLWAYCNNKIELEKLCSWSTEPDRARKLLDINLYKQIGVFKSDKLLENPSERTISSLLLI